MKTDLTGVVGASPLVSQGGMFPCHCIRLGKWHLTRQRKLSLSTSSLPPVALAR
jgi:hypothetical protein